MKSQSSQNIYLAVTVLITEGPMFFVGNYRSKRHWLVDNSIAHHCGWTSGGGRLVAWKASNSATKLKKWMLTSTSQRSRARMLFQINPLLKLMACLSETIVALLLHQLAAIALLVGSLMLLALLSVRLSLKVLVYGAIALTIGVAIKAILRDVRQKLSPLKWRWSGHRKSRFEV